MKLAKGNKNSKNIEDCSEESLNILKGDCDKFSSRLSDSIRSISYAILGTGFAILCTDNTFFNSQLTNFKDLIFLSMAFSLLTLLLDYVQSLVGYRNSFYKYVNKIHHKEAGHKYLYKASFIFFYSKQVAVFMSALIFIGTIIYSIYIKY